MTVLLRMCAGGKRPPPSPDKTVPSSSDPVSFQSCNINCTLKNNQFDVHSHKFRPLASSLCQELAFWRQCIRHEEWVPLLKATSGLRFLTLKRPFLAGVATRTMSGIVQHTKIEGRFKRAHTDKWQRKQYNSHNNWKELTTLLNLCSLYPVFYFYTINDSKMNMILVFMILPYENIVHIRHVFAMYLSTKNIYNCNCEKQNKTEKRRRKNIKV